MSLTAVTEASEVTVGEVKALDAEQALWLVAEREKEGGGSAGART